MRRVVVQITSVDQTGDSLHRMIWPAEQLARQESEWLVLNVDAGAMERLDLAERADLLILFQPHDLDLFKVIHRRRRQGLKTLIECADNFYHPPPSSPAYSVWRSPLTHGVYEEFFRLADGIMVTSEALGEMCRRFERPVHVLKNHLPFDPGQLDRVLKGKPAGVNICWAGSIGHAADLISILPIVEEFVRERDDAMFSLMGNTALPGLLQIESERVHFTPWGDMERYFGFLRTAHIGIVPLLNTPYNRCRSDVKAVEMVGAGVFPLLPKAPPYREFLESTGLPSWETFGELRSLMQRYTEDPSTRSKELERAYCYVQERRLGDKERSRRDLYEAYFPPSVAASKGSWPGRSGFVSFKGTESLGPLWREQVNVVSARLRRGDIEGGASLVNESLRDDDGNPELTLLFAPLLAAAGLRDLAMTLLANGAVRYPKEVRFGAMTALLESDSVKRMNHWQDVVHRLRSLNSEDREGWSQPILDLWRQESRTECVIAIEESFASLFNFSINWRAKRALSLIAQRSPEAIERCDELATAFRDTESGVATFRDYTVGYWRSFAAGLAAQRLGRLGWTMEPH
jgi:hypothetical protein